MNYLIAWHWGWLLAALVIGGIVGFVTFARPRARWVDGPVIVAILVFIAVALVAWLRFVPDRGGYWLELAVLMVAAYVIGCFLGWLVRSFSAGEELVVARAAPAVARTAASMPQARPAPAQAASAAVPVAAAEPAPAPALPNEASHPGKRPVGYLAARGGSADNLKRISGIGRKNEASLHALGVWRFEQIAAWTPENIEWVGSYLAFPGRIDREQWVAQAKLLAAGEETEFSKRVDKGEVESSKGES